MTEKLDILAFGAHPDDVEIGAAGTLARAAKEGRATGIITLTRGEMASRGTVGERAVEFAAAASILGCAHHQMLSLPDGALAVDEASKDAVIREIREHRPTVVLLPWEEDRHPDHYATSRIVQDAAFLAGLRKRDTGQEPWKPAAIVFYMAAWEFTPSFIVDVSDFVDVKRRALEAYGTQLHTAAKPEGQPPTFVSSQHYRDMLNARMAHFGHLIGRSHGEPFLFKGLLEVGDLVSAFGSRVY